MNKKDQIAMTGICPVTRGMDTQTRYDMAWNTNFGEKHS